MSPPDDWQDGAGDHVPVIGNRYWNHRLHIHREPAVIVSRPDVAIEIHAAARRSGLPPDTVA
jgi:hypothetical protein